jgi:hypothetical protein
MRRIVILMTTVVIATLGGTAHAQALSGFVQTLAVQLPEPGMVLLFGIGVGALGLRLGKKPVK